MPTRTLYRLAGVAGLLCAAILLLNTARRGGLLPANDLTHGVAPLAAVLGLFALTGLYLAARERTGAFGLVAYALASTGLAGFVGAEYVTNLIFRHLTDAEIDGFLDGDAGTMLLLTQATFLLGSVLFGAALARSGALPAAAALLFAAGAVGVGLRGVLPEAAYAAGLVATSAGVAWLSVALWQATTRAAPGRVRTTT